MNISGETTKILSQGEGNMGDWSDGTGRLGNAALVVAWQDEDWSLISVQAGTLTIKGNGKLSALIAKIA